MNCIVDPLIIDLLWDSDHNGVSFKSLYPTLH